MGYLREYHKHNWRGIVDYLGSYPRRSCPAVRAWAIGYRALSFPTSSGCSERSLEIRAENDLSKRLSPKSDRQHLCAEQQGGGNEHNSGYRRIRLYWQPFHPAASGRGPSRRTTVRSLKREGKVRAMLKEGGAEPGDRLSFIPADLENDTSCPEAVAGCEYVLHVASPLPPNLPKHEDELIVPAHQGTLRAAPRAMPASSAWC